MHFFEAYRKMLLISYMSSKPLKITYRLIKLTKEIELYKSLLVFFVTIF